MRITQAIAKSANQTAKFPDQKKATEPVPSTDRQNIPAIWASIAAKSFTQTSKPGTNLSLAQFFGEYVLIPG